MNKDLVVQNKFLKKDILYNVIQFLEIQDILNLGLVCKYTHSILREDSTWRLLLLRDMKYFLLTQIEDKQQLYKEYCKNLPLIPDESKWVDQDLSIDEVFKKKMEEEYPIHLDHVINQKVDKIHNFKLHYKLYYQAKRNHINGIFLGDYNAHGMERLRIVSFGYKLQTIKVTGDPNVPKGKISLDINMNESFTEGTGYIHLADDGFKNPRWQACRLKVKNPNYMEATWFIETQNNYQQRLMWGIDQKIIREEYYYAAKQLMDIYENGMNGFQLYDITQAENIQQIVPQ